MSNAASPSFSGYAIAVGSVVLAWLVWLALTPLIGNRGFNSFVLFAIIVTGRFGGFGPSWLAVLLGAVLVFYVQSAKIGLHDPTFPSIIVVYFALATGLVFLTQSERSARELAERSAAEALGVQQLLLQSLEQQERERRMIAYDIHDGIIQYTTGALLFLESYHSQLPSAADASRVEPVITSLRLAIADGRRVMNGIRPPLLDDAGVVAAIDYLVHAKQVVDTDIDFVHDQEFGRLTPELESAIYRIAQEALFNAVKHSRSPKIQISLHRNGQMVQLAVTDWGVGFDPDRVSRGVHGLSGIRERAKLLGGHCDIHSKLAEGSTIRVDLPYAVKV
jgi:signal transduction histidine kinase